MCVCVCVHACVYACVCMLSNEHGPHVKVHVLMVVTRYYRSA